MGRMAPAKTTKATPRPASTATPAGGNGSGTRARIIEASIALFAERGYDATGVQEIVTQAGLTKGAFYHHFDGKDAVLYAIQDRFVDHYLSLFEEIVGRELSSSDALRAVIEELLVVVADYKEEVTIFFQERRFLDTPAFAPVRAKRDQCDARFVALIEEAQKGGGFRALPSARLLAFGINGMCTWAYQWYRPDGMSAREVGQMYADVLLYGMLDDQARKRRPKA